jgi:hypothetical protein
MMFKWDRTEHTEPMFPTIFSLVLALLASRTSAQALAESIGIPNQTSTEIIVGQSREQTNKPRRTRPATALPANTFQQGDPAPFLNPLPQLLKGPHYGKVKRARKHRLDQDHDGFVSKHELDLENQTRIAAFREADQNHDGKLDALELRRYQALLQPRGRSRHR